MSNQCVYAAWSQVENFGMHLNVDGTILYGIKVESIQDKKADWICIDHLSRLLVDVHQDSSRIINDLLSSYVPPPRQTQKRDRERGERA